MKETDRNGKKRIETESFRGIPFKNFLFVYTFLSVSFLFYPFLSLAEDSSQKGTLPDVVIQAKEKKTLSIHKPPLSLHVKENSPLKPFLKVGRELRFKLPDQIVRETRYETQLSSSPYALVPDSDLIIRAWQGEPARLFHPLALAKGSGLEVARRGGRKPSWQLDVVDSGGNVFRRYSGEGAPPKSLRFDGTDVRGNWMDVGQSYTAVLTVFDSMGQKHTVMDSPFALAGLALSGQSGFIIKLALAPLFLSKGAAHPLSPFGEKLLMEAAGYLQRFSPGYNFDLGLYSLQGDAEALRQEARLCGRALARRLLVPERSVVQRVYPETPDLKERVEILVLNK